MTNQELTTQESHRELACSLFAANPMAATFSVVEALLFVLILVLVVIPGPFPGG